eukprot:Gb_17076 [translate_table: standard]
MATMALPFPPILKHRDKYQNQSSYVCRMQIFAEIEPGHWSTKCLSRNSHTTTTNFVEGKPEKIKQEKTQRNNSPSALDAELSALCKDGRLQEALSILYVMDQRGVPVNYDVYSALLHICTNMKALSEGKQVHGHIVMRRLQQNVYLGTKLVIMYGMCGSLVDARHVFDKISKRNVRLWDAIIRGYVRNGFYGEALELYYQMQCAGMQPDKFIFPCVLKACAALGDLKHGKDIHDFIIRCGFESDIFVGNALIDMYIKCGSIVFGRRVFDKMSQRDVVSWSTIIGGYVQNQLSNEALKLIYEMQQTGLKPNSITLSSVLPACAHSAASQEGQQIHNYIIKNAFESDIFVGNALVDMYAKCNKIEIARCVFDKMSQKDVVSWNSIIAGYTQNGDANEALQLFRQMQKNGTKPNLTTVASGLSSCAQLATVQQGMEIHDYIIRSGFELDIIVSNALIDMYAKCGSIWVAREVFDRMDQKDVVSWTAIITGCGMNGLGEEALTLFDQMQQTGLKPNHITFVAILSACSHAGLATEGWHYFNCMSQDYNITPTMDHYACIVDLFGRAGSLDEAHNFIQDMPLEPDAHVWGALLGACRIHCNIELGELVAERLFDLEPQNAGNYVLLSNIYAAAGRWDGVAKMRRTMKDRGVKKSPGCSWIEVKNTIHIFLVGDRSHPQLEEIYAMLESLAKQIKEVGYVPATNFVMHDVEEEEKEYILCGHSEKLAIAFGLINTCPATTIRITKNLRMCGDCHSASKFISKVVQREIVVRDIKRFHHFKDGRCSCGDYW